MSLISTAQRNIKYNIHVLEFRTNMYDSNFVLYHYGK